MGPNQLTPAQLDGVSRPCEGCCTLDSENWYTWGPSTLTCRLCDNCWDYWKKYGGLKMPQTQRIELMAKQQKKLPGQNDEKKGSLRNSTKLVTIEKEKEGGEKSGDDKSGGEKSDRNSPVSEKDDDKQEDEDTKPGEVADDSGEAKVGGIDDKNDKKEEEVADNEDDTKTETE